jgi:hypothetical protein
MEPCDYDEIKLLYFVRGMHFWQNIADGYAQ